MLLLVRFVEGVDEFVLTVKNVPTAERMGDLSRTSHLGEIHRINNMERSRKVVVVGIASSQ